MQKVNKILKKTKSKEKKVTSNVGIPVIASGGAGESTHLVEVLSETHAEAALVASMVHYGTHSCSGIKEDLNKATIPVRMDW